MMTRRSFFGGLLAACALGHKTLYGMVARKKKVPPFMPWRRQPITFPLVTNGAFDQEKLARLWRNLPIRYDDDGSECLFVGENGTWQIDGDRVRKIN